eukprot:CAMPEP_0170866086 /NCGR_PEP_ID=MMETSP0734-20130129/21771_1 /TAXON_ID=186038 /ORGANISM="Fragilariopsis kerguelensis, Strain L26-C5" /LENGTH=74 /DNA_ID=CAMNT_0011242633 /DNA_START=21 /DNA_END=245 /DNA_ORIENTATION=-
MAEKILKAVYLPGEEEDAAAGTVSVNDNDDEATGGGQHRLFNPQFDPNRFGLPMPVHTKTGPFNMAGSRNDATE